MLPDPSRHRLVEGGMGEVLPAELYQQVADLQRGAVDHLSRDHSLDWRGIPRHEGRRWARAVARVRLPVGDRRDPMAQPGDRGKVLFASGFAEPPRVSLRNRTAPTSTLLPLHGWWLEWKLPTRDPQGILWGVEVRDRTIRPWPLMNAVDFGDGEGALFLGGFTVATQGEDEYPELSDELLNLSHVSLVIR